MSNKYIYQERWTEKNGLASKTYKLNKEIAEKFAAVCKQNGDSQGTLLTEYMEKYLIQKEREENVMKAIYEEMLNERNLVIKPAFGAFMLSDEYKFMTDVDKQDEEEIRGVIKLYLHDFTEIAIKKQMLAEAKSLSSCTEKEVNKFEETGGSIVIGMTVEEYMNSFDEDVFDSENEKESYKEKYVVEVEHGVVDKAYN